MPNRPIERAELELSRYPVSVLETVDQAIRKKRLSLTSAAHLLDVKMTSIKKVLLSPPTRADQDELLEHAELPF